MRAVHVNYFIPLPIFAFELNSLNLESPLEHPAERLTIVKAKLLYSCNICQ